MEQVFVRLDNIESRFYFPKYAVSNDGQVLNIDTQRILQIGILKNNYSSVCLSHNCKVETLYVHHLVAHCFLENTFNNKYIDHRDGDKRNNCSDNLRYCTQSQNLMNRGVFKNNKSGFTGIKITKSKNYNASISKNGVKVNLGTYKTILAALDARKHAEQILFGEFAYA